MKKRIAIISNTSWYLFNFRSKLIMSLQDEGYEVITIAPIDKYTSKLQGIGCIHYGIEIDSKSKNPFNEIKILQSFKRIFKTLKPDVILNFTAKPNIWATFAASSFNIPTINNIAGLGLGFTEKNFASLILKKLYKYSQAKARKVFFQNPDDQSFFVKEKIVSPQKTDLLPGSGVDLHRFKQHPIPEDNTIEFRFLLVARMLYSKGIPELVESAKNLQAKGHNNFKISLLGESGINSKDAISAEYLENLKNHSFIEYLGSTDNVTPFLIYSHCVILPSYYREGVPRSLLEALAIGRPIITTNMPGCKETVVENKNGFLTQPKDINDLTKNMERIMSLNYTELSNMGNESRKMAVKKFDEQIVIKNYINSIQQVLKQ